MALLILGLIVFLGTHVFTMARGPRARLIARLGEGPYKGLYSLVSLAGLVLIVVGYGRTARTAGSTSGIRRCGRAISRCPSSGSPS